MSLAEADKRGYVGKATYQQIKDYILAKYGVKFHTQYKLNDELKEDGLIIRAGIYGMGEGHLWFTDKGLCKIEKIRTQNVNKKMGNTHFTQDF